MKLLSLFIWLDLDQVSIAIKEPNGLFFLDHCLIDHLKHTCHTDALSVKILHVKLRPSLKSFIYIKSKRVARTEPCGTLDFIASQEEL